MRLTTDRYHIYQFVEAMDQWIGTGLTLDGQIGVGLADSPRIDVGQGL